MRPSALDRARWRTIDELLDRALETPVGRRAGFLTMACSGDEALRAEVEALLEALESAEGYFERARASLGDMVTTPAGPPMAEVGSFRLLREIARGGMGVVYLAEDTRLGRQVALKVLPPCLGSSGEAKERFISEARAVSALDHPNIATLYEIGQSDPGQPFMAFAFYEGETLKERIDRGAIPLDDVVHIVTSVARGLAAAHRTGIVHRDVKPSNVLLTESGDVKLLDFGVAKVSGEDVTGEGVRLGTVAYMSPEQAVGRPLDARTDLWSLGVVFYEMLTGERPFEGVEFMTLVRSIVEHEPESPSSRVPGLTEPVDRVCERLLRKEADERYQTAEELLADLRALGAGEGASVGAGPRRTVPSQHLGRTSRRRRARWSVVALLGLALAGVGVRWGWPSAGAPARIERVAVLPLENHMGDPDQLYFVDGVHEALITELGTLGTLDVVSRNSTTRFRDSELPIPEIARELDVDAVVEGSVLRSGDSLVVSTQLVAAFPERMLWSKRYDRRVENVLEIAREAAFAITSEASADPKVWAADRLTAAGPVNSDAYDAYLLGTFHLEQRTPDSFEQAQRYLLRAIEIDSAFAPAYGALASVLGSAAFFGQGRPAAVMPRVRDLAETALRADSMLAQARVPLGAVRFYWEWDWAGAEREIRRAIELNPSHPEAYRTLSEVLSATGRYREALAAVERGSELSRFVPFAAFRPAVVLYYMRDFNRAIERAREGLDFFPGFWQGHWILCEALAGRGSYEEAITACDRAATLSGRMAQPLGSLGFVHAMAGNTEEAEEIVAELEERSSVEYVGASTIAWVRGALGDIDGAFRALERAYRERDVTLVHLQNHVFYDPLRSDPRFEALVEAVGITR